MVVDDDRVHADGERLRRGLPGLERLGRPDRSAARRRQRDVAHRGAIGLVGQRRLRIEGQGQDRRRALLGRRIDQPPGHHAGHEAMAARMLLDVADAPCRAARMQVHRELRVVLAGEGVELARPRHHVEHVGEVGRGADRVGERLDALHELGVLDLVERAGPAGELDAGLQLGVALARGRRLPAAGLAVRALRPGTSLLPTWRFGGRCGAIASPATGASSVKVAKASISASSCSGSALRQPPRRRRRDRRPRRRRLRRAPGSSPRVGAEALGSSRSPASRASARRGAPARRRGR